MVKYPEHQRRLLEYLKAMRAEHCKTQDDVARALNLSRSHYTALEGGRSLLNVDHLCSLAEFYRQSVSEFLDGVL